MFKSGPPMRSPCLFSALIVIASIIAAFLYVAVIVVLLQASDAGAHEAPSGMPYPSDCCDPEGKECDPIPKERVTKVTKGFAVTLRHGDHKHVKRGTTVQRLFLNGQVKYSTDGGHHACVGKYGHMIHCLIIPPPMF